MLTFSLFVLLIIIIFITKVSPLTESVNINRKHVTRIESYMDVTERPCNDFYRYACGSWSKAHKNLEYGDTLSLMDHEISSKLEKLMRKPIGKLANETDNIYTKARQYYRACKKVKPFQLKKFLQKVQPCENCTWPIFHRNPRNPWTSENFTWLQAIAHLRRYGLNEVLLEEKVMPRWDDTSVNIIYIDRPSEVSLQPHSKSGLVEIIDRLDVPKGIASVIAVEVHNFELELGKLLKVQDDDGTKEVTLGYLMEELPLIDWQFYLNTILGDEINSTYSLIIQNIPYMKRMAELMNRTDPAVACYYVMVKFLDYLIAEAPQEITRIECVANLRRSMPLAMSFMVGQHLINQTNDTEPVGWIFERLKAKFLIELTKNRLQLKEDEVNFLKLKINSMKLQIGNVPANANITFYDNYYLPVKMNQNNFYANQLALLRLRTEKEHESLTNELSSTYFEQHWIGSSSSPFYVKTKNLIIVPFGFLQLPVYHRKLRNVFKFSSLGFILGHELLHGFDVSGIEYDQIGNMMAPSEEIATNENFSIGLQCMQMEQTPAKNLNEKISDYNGFRLAYETFFDSENGLPTTVSSNQTLPLSLRKLFFLNYAQFFCGKLPKVDPTDSAGYLHHDDHDLDEVRVVQTLMNFEEFSKEFKCKKGTLMNKETKCRLW